VMFLQEPAAETEPDRSLLPTLAVLFPAGATLVLGVLPGLITGILDKASVLRW
jgi:hypothetical protein